LITECDESAKKVYKTRITDVDLSTTPLTNGCHNDDVIQLGTFRSQSLFRLMQISDAGCVHRLRSIPPHTVTNWIQDSDLFSFTKYITATLWSLFSEHAV